MGRMTLTLKADFFNFRAFLMLYVFLGMLPVVVLIFTLIQNNVLDESVAALWGEYIILGIPTNPWKDILPTLFVSILFSLFVAGLGIFLTKYPIQSSLVHKFQPVILFVTAVVAAIAFEFSILQALISYAYFQNGLLVGTPVPPGVSTLLAIFFVYGVYYWILAKKDWVVNQ
jgi:hypothetical protein